MTECKICASKCFNAGTLTRHSQTFTLQRCGNCSFVFVENPPTNYAEIYSEDYYRGNGGDPMINYAEDVALGDRSVKIYECRGIEQWALDVRERIGGGSGRRWLDLGCGTGSLVKFLEPRWDAVGTDIGAGLAFAIRSGARIVNEDKLQELHGSFDVVSSIEVIEHAADPLNVIAQAFALLRSGGIFLFTTGNSTPYLKAISDWSYVSPPVHVSFFNPRASTLALRRCGFESLEDIGWRRGRADLYRYKILKNLWIKRRSVWEGAAPWRLLGWLADMHYKTSAHPVGYKP